MKKFYKKNWIWFLILLVPYVLIILSLTIKVNFSADMPGGLSNLNKEIEIEIVSKRIKQIRKELKMTMRDLALKLNTTSSAISNYENGKYLILSPFLIELCKLSECSIDWVLGRTDNKNIE